MRLVTVKRKSTAHYQRRTPRDADWTGQQQQQQPQIGGTQGMAQQQHQPAADKSSVHLARLFRRRAELDSAEAEWMRRTLERLTTGEEQSQPQPPQPQSHPPTSRQAPMNNHKLRQLERDRLIQERRSHGRGRHPQQLSPAGGNGGGDSDADEAESSLAVTGIVKGRRQPPPPPPPPSNPLPPLLINRQQQQQQRRRQQPRQRRLGVSGGGSSGGSGGGGGAQEFLKITGPAASLSSSSAAAAGAAAAAQTVRWPFPVEHEYYQQYQHQHQQRRHPQQRARHPATLSRPQVHAPPPGNIKAQQEQQLMLMAVATEQTLLQPRNPVNSPELYHPAAVAAGDEA